MYIYYQGMKCRYGTYRVMGETKPILTLVNSSDWEKSLRYDFTEPQNGLWCHFLTNEELTELEINGRIGL